MTSTFTPDVVQYLDGVETLLTSLQTLTTTLGTYVDGLEAGQTSANTKLDTLHTDLDTVEAKLQSLLTGPLSVETGSPPVMTAFTYFSTSDARNGLYQTYTERRESDGKTRTITATRSTSTGSVTSQSIGAWA